MDDESDLLEQAGIFLEREDERLEVSRASGNLGWHIER